MPSPDAEVERNRQNILLEVLLEQKLCQDLCVSIRTFHVSSVSEVHRSRCCETCHDRVLVMVCRSSILARRQGDPGRKVEPLPNHLHN